MQLIKVIAPYISVLNLAGIHLNHRLLETIRLKAVLVKTFLPCSYPQKQIACVPSPCPKLPSPTRNLPHPINFPILAGVLRACLARPSHREERVSSFLGFQVKFDSKSGGSKASNLLNIFWGLDMAHTCLLYCSSVAVESEGKKTVRTYFLGVRSSAFEFSTSGRIFA